MIDRVSVSIHLNKSRTLALETSGREGSVALADGDRVLAERAFAYGLQNAAQILPLIDELCRSHGWTPDSIGRIAVSIGPGSFTGLRIGVTLAKTLAFATGAIVIPVESIEVLAANAPADATEVIVVLDAKRGQIFTARLRRTHDGWTPIEAAHLDTLAAMIERAGRPVHLIGEGIPFHRDTIPDDAGIINTEPATWTAKAAVVAVIAHRISQRSTFSPIDPAQLVPLYIRKPEAEEKADRIANAANPSIAGG